ncbi:MAG: FapA family protein, partial [bacterium]
MGSDGSVAVSEGKAASKQADQGEGLSLMVSDSKMHASAEIGLKFAEKWSPERVCEYISSLGVTFGIDEKAIKNLFKKKIFNKTVVVAKGEPPKNGANGSIRYHIDVDCLRGRPRAVQNGSVDHKNLGLFQAVIEGELLAERIEPTKGTPGRDVYGNEIAAADGKEVKLAGGKNTALSDDGNRLHASVEGCLTGTPTRIEVNPSMIISGDVDYKTGNLVSNVAVVISGGVLAGFCITAEEDVNITGLVDAAEITSGGRIAINAG